jgi:hypothetical protein
MSEVGISRLNASVGFRDAISFSRPENRPRDAGVSLRPTVLGSSSRLSALVGIDSVARLARPARLLLADLSMFAILPAEPIRPCSKKVLTGFCLTSGSPVYFITTISGIP